MNSQWACDVLVVGAGPAGSAAALAAARSGVTVVLAERRQRVGTPVRCAEYVPLPLGRVVNLTDPDVTVQAVRAMRTYLPGVEPRENRFPGVMIRRDRFDRELARRAVEAGVRLETGLQVWRNTAAGIRLRGAGRDVVLSARVIVGADGPCSQVARWMGTPPGPFLTAAQVSLRLVRPLDHTRVYFHPEIPGGYGWVFPKGDQANVGVGIDPRLSGNLKGILKTFKRERIEEGLVVPPEERRGGGLIPVGGLKPLRQENMILAGDAAGTCHPLSGAGVANAIVSGELAGQAAAAAVIRGAEGPLEEYGRELPAALGDAFLQAAAKRETLRARWGTADFISLIRENWIAFREYYKT